MATLSSSSSTPSIDSNLLTKTTTMRSNSIPERKVRVVAKIRGFTETEFQKGDSWISVKKPEGEASESVIVSFGAQSTSQKDSYEIDYCYEQNEGNDSVFSREVKPLISGVFDGYNATVFAYGAKSTGKTSLIQGSCEKPGLATHAMAEILSAAEESGKSISISFFEVFQDRVYDLLDSKRQAVLVLEDKQGKIQLKGLSRVPVRSLLDFQNLYAGQITNKPSQKTTIELPRRSHKGLIIYISCLDDPLRTGKMNFVELAGYEDVRRKSTDGQKMVEQSKTNTSVYAFLNIIHFFSTSTSTSHVPYRESKLARILQDSLGGLNKILMISCLSSTFCQDSLYMVKLASRSSQKVQSVALDWTKNIQNSTRSKIISSFKCRTPKTVSAATKKPATSQRRVPLLEKKINGVLSSISKGRKLFEEKSKPTPSNKNMCMETESLVLDSVSDVKPLADEQENIIKETARPVLDSVTVVEPLADEQEERTLADIPQKAEQTSTSEKGNLPSDYEDVFALIVPKDVLAIGADGPKAITPSLDITTKTSSSSFVQDGQAIEKDDNVTPQISARLRELSNNLKALCFSPTPFALEVKNKNESIDITERKTPMVVCSATKESTTNCKTVDTTLGTPSVRGMKSSIAREYLKFLNTADKEELKRLRGIGEKRATWILELRKESPEPFKSVDDLKNIGLVGKKLKESMTIGGLLFD